MQGPNNPGGSFRHIPVGSLAFTGSSLVYAWGSPVSSTNGSTLRNCPDRGRISGLLRRAAEVPAHRRHHHRLSPRPAPGKKPEGWVEQDQGWSGAPIFDQRLQNAEPTELPRKRSVRTLPEMSPFQSAFVG